MKKTLILATAVALSALSLPALAGQGFVRAELGRSDIDVSAGGFSESDSDTVAGVGGGYWFNRNFAVEGHVASLYNQDLGYDQDFDLVSIGVGVAFKTHFGDVNTSGFFVGARAGVARMTAQVREDDFDVIDDEHSTKPYFGVSAGYDFSERWGLSLNYDRRKGEFNGVDVDVDTITLGGEIRF